jgi:hypothetical protein
MAELTNMAEVTSTTLEERVVRLRTDLHSSPRGRKTITELSPAGMIQTDQSIVDFTDWGQKPSPWSRSR